MTTWVMKIIIAHCVLLVALVMSTTVKVVACLFEDI